MSSRPGRLIRGGVAPLSSSFAVLETLASLDTRVTLNVTAGSQQSEMFSCGGGGGRRGGEGLGCSPLPWTRF